MSTSLTTEQKIALGVGAVATVIIGAGLYSKFVKKPLALDELPVGAHSKHAKDSDVDLGKGITTDLPSTCD